MDYTKITFSGDIMLKSEIINHHKDKNKEYSFDNVFKNIKEFLSESDFVVGNLETPITDNYKKSLSHKYRFVSPIQFAQAVKETGFDLVSTANNHCLDNGIDGIKETIKCLNNIGLLNTGISYKNDEILIKDINGMKIAFLAYTYGTNAFSNHVYLSKKNKETKVNLFQEQELNNIFIRKIYQSKFIGIRIIRKILSKLNIFQLRKPVYERIEKSSKNKREIKEKIKKCKDANVDFIVMCMHEGGQYNDGPIEKTKKTTEFLQKQGVDLIVGNHEHVIHEVEIKNDKLITYSLGNFVGISGVLDEPFNKMSEYSILLHMYIKKEKEGKISTRYTFSILKTIPDEINGGKTVTVKLLYNLINESLNKEERNKLIKDNQKIVKVVTKSNIDINDIKLEYSIT